MIFTIGYQGKDIDSFINVCHRSLIAEVIEERFSERVTHL